MGVHEIDLLAVKWRSDGTADCRHLEVQASMRPVSYISLVSKELQLAGRAANSAKRKPEELQKGVEEWVEKKFRRANKLRLMQTLYPGKWSSELVINVVKSENEVSLIKSQNIKILRLADIVTALATEKFQIEAAAGADILDLVKMGRALSIKPGSTVGSAGPLEKAIAEADDSIART